MINLATLALAAAEETGAAGHASPGLLQDSGFYVLIAFLIVIGVFARAGVLDLDARADARSAVRVPLLADEGGLARALDGALRVLPPTPAPQ